MRLNLSRGFFRLWAVPTFLWLSFAAIIAWDEVSIATRGRYQYAAEFKEGIGNPFDEGNLRKHHSEIFAKPSEARHPPDFSIVEYRYQSGFDDSVKSGSMTLVEFPDASSLYLSTAFPQSEQSLVSRWFWEGRWLRKLRVLEQKSYLFGLALIPPLLLQALWFVGRWIVAGFRRT